MKFGLHVKPPVSKKKLHNHNEKHRKLKTSLITGADTRGVL